MEKFIMICFLIINTISTSFAVEKPQTENLFFADINSPHKSGNGVVYSIEEVNRYSDKSLIRTKYGEGSALSTGVLLVRSVYEIAKEKGYKYLSLTKEYEKGEYTYHWAVFANNEEKSPLEICGDICLGEPSEDQDWRDLKMFDFLWKDIKPLNGMGVKSEE